MKQREIAANLGVITSGLNYCLKALINKGWIKVERFSQSKNKFVCIYLITAQGIAKKTLLAGLFLRRKSFEYKAMLAEIKELKQKLEGALAQQEQVA